MYRPVSREGPASSRCGLLAGGGTAVDESLGAASGPVFAADVIEGILGAQMLVVSEAGVDGRDGMVCGVAVRFHEGEGGLLVRCEKERDRAGVARAVEELAAERDFANEDGHSIVRLQGTLVEIPRAGRKSLQLETQCGGGGGSDGPAEASA
jgi:hypothetical protein